MKKETRIRAKSKKRIATAKPKLETLTIDDTVYKTKFTKKYLERKPFEELDPDKLTAFIPGGIIDVFVNEGDKVKEGDLLAILEAMKMHNQIKAPFDATVKKVNVKKGDNVPKNFVIVELKHDSNE
ncbi:MAG: acetyl-CoA carboxylase biotin carboxyl carrier protein subunit [Lentimicrobiaceae bacterium]|jgi:biotin carboxyl carrier protein|nr:acetyl-CoA carboxylase biotin carboxyl carrier protein subunit [Lentimicrobiaceae bacterium]